MSALLFTGDFHMAQTVTITRVTKEAPSGKVIVTYADGAQTEYASLDDLKEAAFIDADVENCRRVALARWIAADPDASDLNMALGTYKFDLTAVAPISKL
jgi:hypothetical protein